jgi:hypothetical protein
MRQPPGARDARPGSAVLISHPVPWRMTLASCKKQVPPDGGSEPGRLRSGHRPRDASRLQMPEPASSALPDRGFAVVRVLLEWGLGEAIEAARFAHPLYCH